MVPDTNPSDGLTDTRRAIERDAHELRARAYGVRAKIVAALSGIAELRQALGIVIPRRRERAGVRGDVGAADR